MNKKRIALVATGLMSTLLLTACGNSDDSKDLVSIKGGGITQEQYYDKIKTQSTNEQILQQMIIAKVAHNKYGSKVSDEEVNKQYEQVKKAQGSDFDTQLKAQGYTEKSFKEYLRQSLEIQAMLKANIKVTDSELKKAWKSYHPKVEAQIIQVAEKSTATKLEKQLKKDPDKFTSLAKKNSALNASDGGKISFDSTSTEVPSNVQSAAWKLKNGEISSVISAEQTDPSTYQTVKSYYIVKMNKQSDKGNDYKKYKSELTAIVQAEQLNDASFVQKTIKKELKEADVKINDKDLSGVLASFTGSSSSSN